MAVRFIFGRAGSGKTHYCLRAIREQLLKDPIDGPSLVLFTPEQAAVQAERMLLGVEELPGTSRYRTMSFRRLQQTVLEETGFAGREMVGPIGRQMILQYLLLRHRHQLEVLSRVAERPGTAARVGRSIVEFMQEGLLSSHVLAMGQYVLEVGQGPLPQGAARMPSGLLAGKLHDLGLIYQAYLQWLTERDQADPAGLLAETADRLEQCAWLRGASVWVDGFASFSAQQRYALGRIAQVARRVEIALLLDPKTLAGDQPPEPYDLFYRTWQTSRQLQQTFTEVGAEIEEPLVLAGEPARFHTRKTLARIESQLFDTAGPTGPDNGEPGEQTGQGSAGHQESLEFELIEASTRQAEVEAAARKIIDLTRAAPANKALRYRQISVLVRDLEPYHDIFQTVFAAHGIPYFIDKRRSVSHHPLVELVRAMLRLAAEDWPIDAVASLLKTGLVPIPRDRADLVENYLLAHGIAGWANWRGEDWAYLRRFVGADEDPTPPSQQEQQMLRKANHARRVVSRLLAGWMEAAGNQSATTEAGEPVPEDAQSAKGGPSSQAQGIPAGRTGRQWAEGLYTILERLKVPQRLIRWRNLAAIHGGAQGLEQGQQHKQVWALLTQLLDDLVAGLGDEPMDIDQFRATIEAGLEAFSLPLIPPVVDQVVIGSVDRSRQPDITAALVLGFNEGQFPHHSSQDVMLGDSERDLLAQLGRQPRNGSTPANSRSPQASPVELMTGRQRLFDERLLAYIALTRAGQYLWVSYAAADESGKSLPPSPYLRALEAALPGLKARRVSDPVTSLCAHEVGTAWQAATGVVLLGRAVAGSDNQGPAETQAPDVPAWSALGRWMIGRPPFAEKVRRVASACDYANDCAVRPEQASALFGQHLRCSASQLQEYAVCPYRYFVHYGLRLAERPEFELAAVELGSFYHRILYKLATKVQQRGQSLRTVPFEVLNDLLNRTTDEEAQAVVKELALTGGREEYLLERAKVDIGSALRGHLGLWRNSRFDPAVLEAGFGTDDGWQGLEIRTPKGRCAVLRGKIDRIDVAGMDPARPLAVIDYKRSSKYKLRLDDAMAGLQVQLIVYMKAAIQAAEKGGLGPGAAIPGGMYYFNILPTWEKVAPGDLVDPKTGDDGKQWTLKGFTNTDCLPAFYGDEDEDHEWPVEVRLKNDGQPYANCPAVSTAEFHKIIDHVWRLLGETVDRIADGEFPVAPYRAGEHTPCAYCPFDTVCRFSPEFNQHRRIPRHNTRSCLNLIDAALHGAEDEARPA